MRLLTVLIVAELALAGAGLVAAVMLIGSTTRLQRLTAGISSSVESVYAAEQAGRSLLIHAGSIGVLAGTARPGHEQDRERGRREFESSLSVMRNHVNSEQEREVLTRAEASSARYFREVEQLEAQAKTPETITVAVAGTLDETEAALNSLISINYAQAQDLQESARTEEAVSNRVGLAAAAAVLLILGTAFYLLDRYLRRPLQRLKRQMEGLEAGRLALIEADGPPELREIVEVFNDLVGRLQQQREFQLRFIAGVAHDLRTPLNAMQLCADCMVGENLDPEQRRTLQAIERQISQLNQQVGDLLDTARIESGQLSLKPSRQDLRAIIENCATIFRGASPRHTMRLALPDGPVTCECDPTRIGQVMSNLISNAIKYSPSGGDVTVTLSCEAAEVHVSVADEGIGIAPDDLPHVFEAFRRTASTRETIPGVGLGLSVSKRIAEAHGGAIEIASVRGAGSTFTLRLPCPPAAAPV
jgi:signal transduction histidine kinase